MKIIVKQEEIIKPLQQAVGIVDRKSPVPILNNLLIKTEANRMLMLATDSEIELTTQIVLSSSESEQAFTLPARKLLDICRTIPDNADIEFSLKENNTFLVRSGKSQFKLSTLPAEEFPRFSEVAYTKEFTIKEADFRELLDYTHFAMAQHDVRYYFNGVLLELRENKLTVVATDGHRLAVHQKLVDYREKNKTQIIIPRKTVSELLRLLGSSDENITVKIDQNRFCVIKEEFTITSKLIDGKFPDYERLMANQGDKHFMVDNQEIKSALSRVSILANDKQRQVRLQLRSGLLRIKTNNMEQEIAEDEIAIEYQGEDLDIGFNINYLLDICNAFPGGEARFYLSSPESSAYIENANKTGGRYVVMPTRL